MDKKLNRMQCYTQYLLITARRLNSLEICPSPQSNVVPQDPRMCFNAIFTEIQHAKTFKTLSSG